MNTSKHDPCPDWLREATDGLERGLEEIGDEQSLAELAEVRAARATGSVAELCRVVYRQQSRDRRQCKEIIDALRPGGGRGRRVLTRAIASARAVSRSLVRLRRFMETRGIDVPYAPSSGRGGEA